MTAARRHRRRLAASVIALFLVILAEGAGNAGELRSQTPVSGEGERKRMIALSLRIAQAKNNAADKSYYRSLARQQKKRVYRRTGRSAARRRLSGRGRDGAGRVTPS